MKSLHPLHWLLFFILPIPAFACSPEAARQVFDDLVQVIGRGKTQPTFSVDFDASNVAEYLPASNQIKVSSKFLAFSDRFGEQSEALMALVLGHELAHHYENHNLRLTLAFAANNASDLQAPQRQALETEADYFAVFFASMAGYSIENLGENFLRELYHEFGIADGDTHYASLQNRLETFRSARAEIGELVQIFEAGNLLLLTGNPEAAAHCFEHVGMKFTSPGVWNNAGVAYFLASLEYLPEDSPADTLLFPVEFAEEMRPVKRGGSTRRDDLSPDVATVLRLKFLSRARESFERAMIFEDSPTLAATANLACAQLMLAFENALPSAERELHKFDLQQSLERIAFQFPGNPAAAQIAVLKGIAAALSGDGVVARKYFKEAAEKGSIIGKINLNESHEPAPPDTSSAFERLHDLRLLLPEDRAAFQKLFDRAEAITLPGWSYTLTIRCKPLPTGQAVWVEFHRPELFRKTTLYALQAGKGYPGTNARNIRLGSPEKQVREKYGLPEKALSSGKQEYWTYREAGLVFCLSKRQVTDVFHFYSEVEEE